MRYFLGFLIAIGLIVLVFILILKAFSGGSGSSKSAPAPLISYAKTATMMQLTIDGPIIANQNHQAVQIDVSQNNTKLDIIQGYQGKVVNTQSFGNNQASYSDFLQALNVAGYTKGISSSTTDYSGYCPFGERYVYKVINSTGQTTQQYWATSCGGQGDFKGRVVTVNEHFQKQIPDYNTLTQNLGF